MYTLLVVALSDFDRDDFVGHAVPGAEAITINSIP